MSGRLLIIEDDSYIVSILEYVLTDEHYEVRSVSNGEDGWEELQKQQFDLIILDINLPGIDGLTLCNRIKRHMSIPVVILSSRDNDDDVISGLEIGADDYIKKPFNHRELILRIGKLLSRSGRSGSETIVSTGDLVIDLERSSVQRSGITMNLTPTEYDILSTLARNIGRIVSWQVICQEVWGTRDWEGGHELVKVNIRRLRKKVETDPSEPIFIMNEWGRGYRLQEL